MKLKDRGLKRVARLLTSWKTPAISFKTYPKRRFQTISQGRNIKVSRAIMVRRSAASKIASLENRTDGLTAVNIGSEISNQIKVKFDKTFIDARFRDLGKVAEQGSGPGLVLNYGDLRVFTDGEGNVSAASYIVGKVSELLRRSGRRVWLIGATASNDVYEKMVRKFPNVEKDWDLQLLTITNTLSLMGSFVPFGGFFSTPYDMKLPFSGFNKEITGPVSSISDQTQSTLPPWLQMTTIPDLNQKSDPKVRLLFSSPTFNIPALMKFDFLDYKLPRLTTLLHYVMLISTCIYIPSVQTKEGLESRRNTPRNPLRRNCPRNVLRRYIVFPMNSGLVCPHRNIVGSSSE
ncbi:hypothetical protein F2Q70_00008666 [Brassica cretica]|uniref:SMAX1-like nucleotide binding domain-containing protein n=1 Tax=Brassica cretica TaxID=69181 RepID=A0A8S9LZI3_BRACR|nr:hypothetical protein F2Q70_00008666 [Brassica cretica]